jgi:hypothetical protein
MIPASSITDDERGKFLRKLDASDLTVTDWEARFIGSFLAAYRNWQFWTDGRRSSADKMRMKYGSMPEIDMPFPLPPTQRQPLPEAEAGGCQFLIFGEDRRQRPCNEPAAWRRQNGFRYCEMHAEAVLRDLKRHGAAMNLTKL